MTVQGILARLFDNPKGLTTTGSRGEVINRVKKAQGLAVRSKIDWQEVLHAMTDEQRKAVADV